jgi:DNA topoisomerase-1
VQAIGYDSAGRLQYRYHDKYRERKEREKFERILDFADRLPRMRRVTSGHLRHERLDREKVLACMTRMMNAAYFRVGDERYAKNNNLRHRHAQAQAPEDRGRHRHLRVHRHVGPITPSPDGWASAPC